MKLLVTGGAGFIGSNFIRFMFNERPDIEVINLDKLTYAGNLDNLKELAGKPNYLFVQGDIADGDLVQQLFGKGIDAVINFAAESHVDRSILEPDVFIKTNVVGTQVLLEQARQSWRGSGGQRVRFIQISTDEVYGSLGAEGYFTESTPLAPNSPYSASKAGADLLVRAYYHTYGLPVAITRCSNNYGPYQFPEKLIPLMILKALQDEPLPVYGNGLNVRDWLHVEDHCRAIYTVLTQGRPGEVYNIGGNQERTNLEVVKGILNIMGKPESLISFVQDRPGHDHRYAIDAGKIQRELGWRPRHDFASGLANTVQWYLNNRQWWEPLIS
ncbi:dTDP-glucose 4,6-dehydratase [Desulfotomaculum nigrificans CO-1-SRB]|uniref:dTDP-glucose 4,6-dehydratase n=1 Tax=Desulfotomaculum nigrificans (strain DSM 14880 / VKM B-2319 / CO-1-SRB) TaxID=868595 RepID=F6B9R4_DESCC|nr:dTDP-glucose 4,6-dehydratase [Desulfotomaculum nigrificans]AEF93762.1 dTDP-glucose 4,6-dehydratase [Desulfotomaculum nigrificans CO-1-SRB]